MERFHTLELNVQKGYQSLFESKKSLEIFTGPELQALQKTVVKRFEIIKEIIRTDEQRVEVQGQDLASLVRVGGRDDLPRVLATYPVISSDKPSSNKYPKGFKECKWKHIGVSGLKEIKQAVVSYDFHPPFVRKMVKIWA